MTKLIVSLACVVGVSALVTADQKPPKVRVHFWTAQPAPGRIVETSQKDRQDAAKDLAAMVRRKADKELVVTAEAESQIQVEVMGRGRLKPGTRLIEPERGALTVTLRFGEFAQDFECDSIGAIASGRWTAARCIEQIKAWVEANRAQFTKP